MNEKIYSNPRTEAVIHNWPFGRTEKATAHFRIEKGNKGKNERAVRVITDPLTGRKYAPKKLTFANKVRIVDGDDGKTYLIEETKYGFFSVMRGDMKYEEESIHVGNPRFEMAKALFLPGAESFI